MDDALGDPSHPLDDRLPVPGQLLHARVVQVHAVRVELAVGLARVRGQVVVGADDHVVIVYEVGPQAVREGPGEEL